MKTAILDRLAVLSGSPRAGIHRGSAWFGCILPTSSFCVGAIIFALTNPASASDVDLGSPTAIVLLQKRLRQIGCFAGPADGVPSEAFRKAVRACPSQSPQIGIETGRPTTPIRRVAVDAACRLAATISYDKVVRLLSLPDGRLQRVLRLPSSDGDELDGLAMSADGRWVATGGWDARENRNALFLFDTANGQTVTRLGSYANQVGSLAFSPDGTRLAVAMGDEGVRVLEVPSGREVRSDPEYTKSTNAMAYGPDGSLYVASYDGIVRRYGPDGTPTDKAATMNGRNPFTLAVSRDGQRLAVGFADSRHVELFEAATLRNLGSTPSEHLRDDNVSRVAWATDGRLIAGGDTSRPESPLHRFDSAGKREADLSLPAQYVLDLQPCGDATIVAAVEPPLSLIRPNDTFTVLARSDAADMRFKVGEAFKASPDGTRVQFHLGYGATGPAVLVDIAAGTVSPAPRDDAELVAPLIDTLTVDRESGKVSAGEPALSTRNEAERDARSLATRPDRGGFVLGSWSKLRVFDATGKLRWSGKSAMPVGGVHLAAHGDLVVVAYLDGTIRWFRWSDGRELLAIFVHRGDLRYVAWTPSGYHEASPGGESLFGWQFNSNWARPADFLPSSVVGARLRRPDVIRRILSLQDEATAVRAADAALKPL